MTHLRNSLMNKTPVRTHVEKDVLELKLSWKFCRKSYQGREWRQRISSSGVSEVYAFLQRNLNMKRYFRAYVWNYPKYEGGNLDYRLQAHIIVLWIRLCIILNILLIYFLKSRPFIFQGSILSFKLTFGATPLWFDKIIIFSMFKELFFDKPASVGEKYLVYYFVCFFMLKYKTSLASLL